jgi:uncharacterized membrane protein YeaQ/YmgE (transglycosylase-associated protein family)
MTILNVIASIVVGFLVGLVARAIVPGSDSMGFLATSALGIVGSFLGAFVGGKLSKAKPGERIQPAGCFLSLVGAVLLLALWRVLR